MNIDPTSGFLIGILVATVIWWAIDFRFYKTILSHVDVLVDEWGHEHAQYTASIRRLAQQPRLADKLAEALDNVAGGGVSSIVLSLGEGADPARTVIDGSFFNLHLNHTDDPGVGAIDGRERAEQVLRDLVADLCANAAHTYQSAVDRYAPDVVRHVDENINADTVRVAHPHADADAASGV